MKPYNKNNVHLAKELRKNMTPSEKKLWYQFLKNYDIRFQRQKPLGNYIADFYCAKARIVIELDGGGHYEENQIQKDIIRTNDLVNMNLSVLRFTNTDIQNNFNDVCALINKTVKSSLS
ncbi:MAG: endonuclease domain-containing protein [Clostridia bacterium]|nr:endonuclease domain-containing protein [Clostridia bacterium]